VLIQGSRKGESYFRRVGEVDNRQSLGGEGESVRWTNRVEETRVVNHAAQTKRTQVRCDHKGSKPLINYKGFKREVESQGGGDTLR